MAEKQKLEISDVLSCKEVEPAIFEIELRLDDGQLATLRLNGFTLQSLRHQIFQGTFA